jgi:Mu-like prophage I protein
MPSTTIQIHTFRSGVEGAKALPTRLLVAKWGEVQSRRGPVIVNELTLAQLPGNQLANKFDRVAFDWNHNTLDKSAPEPKTVAGFGTPRVVAGEGIWLEDMEYTPEGRELLPGGHYPDISPAVERNAAGVVLFLHSVGAVRQGELDELVFPFSADFQSTQPNDKTNMQSPELTALIALLAALGMDALPETPTAEQVAAAATAAQTKIDDMKKPAAKPEVEGFAAITARLDKMEADATTARLQAMLDGALAVGKAVPFAAALALRMTPEELAAELAKLPAGAVPGVAAGHDIKAFAASGAGDSEGLAIFASMGLTPAEYAAATKAA